ncbi:MAG: SCO family protein [Rickettsiales bacterium]
MKKNLFKIVSILGVCLILFSLVVIITKTPEPKPKAGSIDILEKAKLNPSEFGGDFVLTNQDDLKIDSKSLRGKYLLVYFGFTNCPDICPASIMQVSTALEDIKSKDSDLYSKLQLVFITIDPERDTSEVLKNYFDSMGVEIMAFTGTPEEVSEVAKKYRVYYSTVEGSKKDKGNYLVNHSSFFYLVGPDGKFIKHYIPNAKGEEIAKDIIKIFAETKNNE